MAIIGGNIETKNIGLKIDSSGTFDRTYLNSDGHLQLKRVDFDGSGNPIYESEGSWTSNPIDLGDKFNDFQKIFTTHTDNGVSSIAISTRVSDNGIEWSNWRAIAYDGTILSETKQFIQIKITLYAGFVTDVFLIPTDAFDNQKYIEKILVEEGGWGAVPQLTSSTHVLGTAFTNGSNAHNAFNGNNSNQSISLLGQYLDFYVGFKFNSPVVITKYRVNMANIQSGRVFRKWFFQGSVDTTNGHDGTWEILDYQDGVSWTSVTERVYELENSKDYIAYRIFCLENNGANTHSEITELDMYKKETHAMKLRTLHTDEVEEVNWFENGHVVKYHFKKDEWLKIDSIEVRNYEY